MVIVQVLQFCDYFSHFAFQYSLNAMKLLRLSFAPQLFHINNKKFRKSYYSFLQETV